MASSSSSKQPEQHDDIDVRGTYLHLFYARRTVMQMLRDRGYCVPVSELSATLSDFRAVFGDFPIRKNLTLRFNHLSSPLDKIIVVFPDPPVNVATLKSLIEQMKDEGTLKSIVVLRQPLRKPAKDCISIVFKSKYSMEIFLESELLVNTMEHAFVPKHISLSNQEKKELLGRIKIDSVDQLPYLLEDDPVARYYGFKKGEIIKILRTHNTGEEDIFYRLVVRAKSED